MAMGNVPTGVDVVLGLTSLNRLVDHQPSDLTATLEAGMTLAKTREQLGAAGQHLPLQAPCPERATIGGILATGYVGPLGLAYGMPRDWLIGIKVANANGTVTKAGGRVVKNVTGYDLNKLYTGSLGTLGVIVETSFKLSPKPSVSRTILAVFDSLTDAGRAASALLKGGFTPHALVLTNGEATERLTDQSKGYCLLALFQGRPRAVETKLEEARRVVKDSGYVGIEELEEKPAEELWQHLIDLSWVGDQLPALSIRFNLLPSQTTGLAGTLDAIEEQPYKQGIIADPGSGWVRSLWWTPSCPSSMDALVRRVTSLTDGLDGRWVIERCPTELKEGLDVWGSPPNGLDLMRRIKAKLDPTGILNSGRFVGGL